MTSRADFTQTPPELHALLDDLRALEPIFHTPAFGTTPADFDRRMAPTYWEVGASGRRYSRGFILTHLAQNPPLDAATSGWQATDHALQQPGPHTYLLTYTLQQNDRLTRRSTIWQSTEFDWQVLYHQGTFITAPQDDIAP